MGFKTLGPRVKEIFWELQLLILFLIQKVRGKTSFFFFLNALVNLNYGGKNLE